MCIYIYIYIYIYKHVHIHTFVYVYIYIYILLRDELRHQPLGLGNLAVVESLRHDSLLGM